MYLQDIYNSLNLDNNAICYDEKMITYRELSKKVNGIRLYIRENIKQEERQLGIVVNSHPYTYAAILAIWLEGKFYVPLLPSAPEERNTKVVEEAHLKSIFANHFDQLLPASYIELDEITDTDEILAYSEPNLDEIAYLLFTSGSTGRPKGVPISFNNVQTLLNSMDALGYKINSKDKCLQMFDLTFDLSVISYVMPFAVGACIYIIPDGEIKSDYIVDLLEEYHLTVLGMVPSVLNYIGRFFDDIKEPQVKLCWFCGEALSAELTGKWHKCIPNAEIVNFYGPTEDTVYCMYYIYRDGFCKHHNGYMSIGKSMPYNECDIFIDGIPAKTGEHGELCLSGGQLTKGYWENPEKNAEAFFVYEGTRYYRTGDLCFKDEDGDVMYVGRIDFQAKIQGFRVELSEIEHFVSEFLGSNIPSLCVAFTNKQGNTEIGMAVESKEFDPQDVLKYIKSKLPPYEVPTKVLFFDRFPLNSNGKLDRKKIAETFAL